ncbi:MAG: STAS/SEC14 domain-containing protein, partial [Arenimonas sp.]
MQSYDDPDFQVAYRKRGDTLHFKVSGDVDSQAIRIAYWQEIVAITKREGLRKLLVIDRKKHKPASPEELAQLAAMMQIHSNIVDRIAVVEPTAKFVSAMEHAEIEGREFGFNVRIFNRVEDAERWLMYGSSDEA